MSRINELIEEFCPDGVEFRNLENCCCILDKFRKPVTKSARVPGPYPYYGANGIQDYVSEYLFDGTFVLVGEDGSVMTEFGKPVVNWATGKIWVNNHAHIVKESEGVLLRYLFHCLLTVDVHDLIHGNIPKLNQTDFRQIKIPVPPLPVQQEIVRILDTFTELDAELKIELETREKQYEYYRDKLLTLDKSTGFMRIDQLMAKLCPEKISFRRFGEIATIVRGASPRPINQFITTDSNGINWIKIGDISPGSKYVTSTAEKITIEGAQKSRSVMRGDFILSNSMSFGRPYILKCDGCIHDGWLAISNFNRTFLPDFLFHLLNSNEYQRQMKQKASFGGAVQNLNADIVKNLLLPTPPLPVQEEIVRILDRFDTLCNDQTSGLPAEIEARRKQYEYYRDKLLTFKELEA